MKLIITSSLSVHQEENKVKFGKVTEKRGSSVSVHGWGMVYDGMKGMVVGPFSCVTM